MLPLPLLLLLPPLPPPPPLQLLLGWWQQVWRRVLLTEPDACTRTLACHCHKCFTPKHTCEAGLPAVSLPERLLPICHLPICHLPSAICLQVPV